MKPTRGRNTKARPDLRAPVPGTDFRTSTRSERLRATPHSDNRPSDRGHRNRENSLKDRNLGSKDSSGRPVSKTRTGSPKQDLRAVQPEIINPPRVHRTSDLQASTPRELHRRRKQIRRAAQPARRKKQTATRT